MCTPHDVDPTVTCSVCGRDYDGLTHDDCPACCCDYCQNEGLIEVSGDTDKHEVFELCPKDCEAAREQ